MPYEVPTAHNHHACYMYIDSRTYFTKMYEKILFCLQDRWPLVLKLPPPDNMTPPFEGTILISVLYSRFESSTEVAMVRPPVTVPWRCALETMSSSLIGVDQPWASPRRRHRWGWGCSWMESWLRVQRCSDSPAARNTQYVLANIIDILVVGSWHGHFGYDIIFLGDR